MGLNLRTFKIRATTALIFLVVMLGALLLNGWSFLSICIIITLGCIWELFKLSRLQHRVNRVLLFFLGSIFIVTSLLLYINFGLGNAIQSGSFNLEKYAPTIPCLILFSIWVNDTMAYIVGSIIGKTPLSPISPKKTWEGTIGGIVLCVLLVGTCFKFLHFSTIGVDAIFHSNHTFYGMGYYIIAFICAVFGTLGDLAQSKLKRIAGVKDSGNFMPGHGGFLDRFDSLLLAVPAVWIFLQILSHF